MSKSPELLLAALAGAAFLAAGLGGDPGSVHSLVASQAEAQDANDAASPVPKSGFGLGREAMEEEVAAWDIDVRPDGSGLPEGSGTVMEGEEVYIAQCASCHGDFGEAIGRWPVLAGGEDTLQSDDPVKTPGSYWPYLSTIYDYVHRAMPFGNAQSLSDDETYALTAYILYLNFLVEDDFELSKANFAEVEMPNADGFFRDDRGEVELTEFSRDVCMENCKESVEITMRARVLDVTPGSEDGDGGDSGDEAASAEQDGGAVASEGTEMAATDADGADGSMSASAEPDAELVASGETVFDRRCGSCHQVGEGADNGAGPLLNGVVGSTIGSVEGFRYSSTFEEAHDAGETWTEEELASFLADPRGDMEGTRMSFQGLKSDDEIAAVIAYLKSAQ